jgi:hypothetical protein
MAPPASISATKDVAMIGVFFIWTLPLAFFGRGLRRRRLSELS